MIALLLRYWHFAVIAALVGLLGVQQVRVSDYKTEIAELKQKVSDERADREAAARAHVEELRLRETQHTQAQQLKDKDYAQKLALLEAGRRDDRALIGSLRGTIASYTAIGQRPGETDAAALERASHRLQTIGQLLDEGVELVIESRRLVEQRDAEVARLLDQIRIDRAACSPQSSAALGS